MAKAKHKIEKRFVNRETSIENPFEMCIMKMCSSIEKLSALGGCYEQFVS